MKFNGLIPELSVSSISKSKNFYIDIIGFDLEYEREEDKFAFVSLGEAQIMLEEINGYWNTGELQYPFRRGINFQINTDDICKITNKLKLNNINLFRDIMENHYKCNGEVIVEKEILVQDPDGYLLRFSQTKKQLDNNNL
jgi:catechol 2,3-dioxygenase-like lactoylglutathione lyase family enzyme